MIIIVDWAGVRVLGLCCMFELERGLDVVVLLTVDVGVEWVASRADGGGRRESR